MGLKVSRIGDMLQFHLKYKWQVFVSLLTSLIGLIMICHYVSRLEYVLMVYYWYGAEGGDVAHDEGVGGKCKMMKNEWGSALDEMLFNRERLCNNSIAKMSKYTG